MKRIGITASKIAKGNFLLYNFYVVLISFLFSFFVFVVAGAMVVFALTIIRYISEEIMLVKHDKAWSLILGVCLACLTVITVIFNFMLILHNFRIRPPKNSLNGNGTKKV